jgi:NAD(P)-dependent dehydrogenase (short-subunit alcohol dehydrogenase family)
VPQGPDEELRTVEIQGSAALVTGAASGLGAATARRLTDAGATVFGLDLEQSIERVGDAAPEGVTLIPTDVTSAEGVQSAIDRIVESGLPLRTVVNCAGVGWAGRILSKNGPHDLELFRTVITVNLLGTFNVMRLAADAIAKTEPVDESGQRGVVVNTASVAAFEGQVGQIAYSASKGGVHGMTVPAARDLAQYGIRVNTIAPGIVDTPMLAGVTEEYRKGLEAGVPFPSRLAQPAEYAQLVQMIVEHDYLNGETIRMDGALRMAPR